MLFRSVHGLGLENELGSDWELACINSPETSAAAVYIYSAGSGGFWVDYSGRLEDGTFLCADPNTKV